MILVLRVSLSLLKAVAGLIANLFVMVRLRQAQPDNVIIVWLRV